MTLYDEIGQVLVDDAGNELPDRFILPVVYFIEAVGLDLVKIGYTEELIRRFKEIRTSCPVQIRLLGFLPGDKALEANLHRQYKQFRGEGEWFRLSQQVMDNWREHLESQIRSINYGAMYRDFQDTCTGNREEIKWRPRPQVIDTYEEVYSDLMEEVAEGFANV